MNSRKPHNRIELTRPDQMNNAKAKNKGYLPPEHIEIFPGHIEALVSPPPKTESYTLYHLNSHTF